MNDLLFLAKSESEYRYGFWQQVVPRPEVGIVLLYLVLASLWVAGSDMLIDAAIPDRNRQGMMQTVKGLKFVLTTAVLFYFVLRRVYRRWRSAERAQQELLMRAKAMFRDLSARVQSLREEDRSRISRELHDELGQSLTALKLELRWIEDNLGDRDDRALNPVLDRMVEAVEVVDSLIAAVQRISFDLRPAALDALGLLEALQEEALRFTVRTQIPCEVKIGQLPDPLPTPVATAAFRIFQEALTNVARHAGARQVKSDCRVENGGLKLTIHDDGTGIDLMLPEDPGSLGLLGMRERAERLGGKVDFARNQGGGTRVDAFLPLPVTSLSAT